MSSSELERQQEDAAAAEAGAIGGRAPAEDDESLRPVKEAGGGEAEGFEQAEDLLIEHASHGDQHAARQVIEDAPTTPDDPREAPSGEADTEYSSERSDDDR
ncbi:MAG: hypothetical protein ACR2L9_04235 [Solirubrobacteraceae bacterium]